MNVAPTTGAGIETLMPHVIRFENAVAPTTGAWIETVNNCTVEVNSSVAPTTGAWIETQPLLPSVEPLHCRSHHGSVD